MGQILHGSAKTTHAVRAAIQRSKASIQELASRYDLNPKTVMKWRKRAFLYDAPMGPKVPRSTVLSAEEEALAVAFRKHTLLPLDDCLYALQATILHLTRSSLHRLFQRHEISRLPAIEGETGRKKAFKRYPIGYFHIDIAEVRTEEGKLHLFVAIDRRPDCVEGFFCPGVTDGFERREPIQSLETLGEVVGVEECLDVLAKLVVAVVMVAPNSRLFESTVHPLDLPVRPRMIWLCQPMLNPVRSAEQIEHMGLPPRSRT